MQKRENAGKREGEFERSRHRVFPQVGILLILSKSTSCSVGSNGITVKGLSEGRIIYISPARWAWCWDRLLFFVRNLSVKFQS